MYRTACLAMAPHSCNADTHDEEGDDAQLAKSYEDHDELIRELAQRETLHQIHRGTNIPKPKEREIQDFVKDLLTSGHDRCRTSTESVFHDESCEMTRHTTICERGYVLQRTRYHIQANEGQIRDLAF